MRKKSNRSVILIVTVMTLALAPISSQAGFSFKNPFKSKKKAPPVHNNGGAAAVHNQHHNAAEQIETRLTNMKKRAVKGKYQTSRSPLDEIAEFNGLFDPALNDKIINLTEGSPVARLKTQSSLDLLSRGVSVLPDANQLSALKVLKTGLSLSQANLDLVAAYRDDIQLHRGNANYQINERASENIYDRVNLDDMVNEYEAYSAVLDTYGHAANDKYTPAPAAIRD